jgi:uncharacterized protein YaaN involved in tellurite resistance
MSDTTASSASSSAGTTTTVPTATPAFVLQAPEPLAAVPALTAKDAVPLPDATSKEVDEQVQSYIDKLMSEDLHSEAFKARLDSAFRLGKEEVSSAAAFMTGRFMERNFVGMEDSAAYKAISDLRVQLDELNPGKDGDLLSEQKILGFIPFGNKLQSYFRKYQSAGTQLQKAMEQLHAARDDMHRDAVEIEATRGKLWESMLRLKAAIRFCEQLDARLADKVAQLKTSDPERGRALEQEVLFYARQNLSDLYTQLAVSVNGYLSLGELKKTAREMMNGCDRVATTGMSALAVAQTVARATGNQIKVMDMLKGVSGTIDSLIAQSSQQLGQHVERTGEFAANPLIGVERLKETFDNTFKAMDAMDTFRSKAIDTMGRNNQMMKEQVLRAEQYLDRSRGEKAREAMAQNTQISGPVSL